MPRSGKCRDCGKQTTERIVVEYVFGGKDKQTAGWRETKGWVCKKCQKGYF